MAVKIFATLLCDPDLAETVRNLQQSISRKYLPGLGQAKQVIAEKAYQEEKTKLFIQISEKLRRGPLPPTQSEMARRANQMAVIYFVARMWRHSSRQKYFPVVFVGLVAFFLCAAAPGIYAALEECERSWWAAVGTVAGTACDILESAAIECTIIFAATTARETLLQVILPVIGLAKFAGKVGKVSGRFSVQAAAEVAGEAVLVYRRVVAVAHLGCCGWSEEWRRVGGLVPRRSLSGLGTPTP